MPALGRGGLLAASLFVVWHATAVLVAPFPASHLSARVHAVFYPYLSALFLDTDWGFFAPTPSPGRFVRYTVVTRAGASRVFRLTEDLRPGPSRIRFQLLHEGIHPSRPQHAEAFGRILCRRHADLAPLTVTFSVYGQIPITPEAYLAGRRPLDADALEVDPLPAVSCP